MPLIGKSALVPEIEEWISRNKCKGEVGEFNIQSTTVDEPKQVNGIRYGLFGVHRVKLHYRCTHIPTGQQCGPDFKDLATIQRFINLIHNWGSWRGREVEETIRDFPLREALAYCQGIKLSEEGINSILLAIRQYVLPRLKTPRKKKFREHSIDRSAEVAPEFGISVDDSTNSTPSTTTVEEELVTSQVVEFGQEV
jgi:hypothetical protein